MVSSNQWGESRSPIVWPVAWKDDNYKFFIFHKTMNASKVIVVTGANDRAKQYFDLWNANEKTFFNNDPYVMFIGIGGLNN